MMATTVCDEQLALFGGPQTITGDLKAAGERRPVTDWARRKIMETIDARGMALSSAPIVREFEQAFAQYTGSPYCISVNNGTAAIRAALWACGVGPGDEVITTSYTCWPTTMPIVGLGAKAVFADIEADTLTLDPADVRRRITPKTKAVIVVHMVGLPADLDPLVALCKEHSLHLIEDCCLAPGARYHGRHVGTFGTFGAFSMQAGKALPSGEGGLLIGNDHERFEAAIAHGDCPNKHPLSERWTKYGRSAVGGVKHRLNTLSAILCYDSLKTLDEYLAQTQERVLRFQEGVLGLPGLSVPRIPADSQTIYYYNTFLYDARETGVSMHPVVDALRAEGIGIPRHAHEYMTQHAHSFFVERGSDPDALPIAGSCTDRVMQLPRLTYADDALIEECVQAFHKVWSNLDRLRDAPLPPVAFRSR